MNATANESQTLYQSHSAPNVGTSANLPFSSSTVNPINFSSVNTQVCTVPFFAMNKSLKTFDGLDHQFTPEELMHT